MRLPLASIALLGSATAFSTHSRSSWSPSFTSTSTSSALSASGGRLHVRPIGIGSCAPQTILTNFDLESVHDTSDEWIKSRTGIEQRHVLVHEGTKNVAHVAKLTGNPVKDDANGDAEEEGGAVMVAVDGGQGQVQPETLRTLGIDAARNALAMSGLTGADIDLVICATSSPDDLFGDAPSIADAVGCDKGKVMAFDLTAACSGFLFGIVTAGQFLQNSHGSGGSMKNALVLGADALTRWVDWDDRNSCILFGDGAGAMVLTSESSSSSTDDDDGKKEEDSENDGFGILGYAAHSNGAGYNDLKCIYRGEPKKITTPGEGTTVHDGSYDLMTMNGRKVYSFATREVPNVLEEAMDNAGITVDQVDWLLLHQANIRIMEVVAERLGMPMDKVITNLYKYGNTSAASIPLALDEAVRSGKVKKGDVIACAGFGAGLSWGAAILKWG